MGELNRAFGFRLAMIPLFIGVIGMSHYHGIPSLPDIGFKFLVALTALYTIVGPAEYLYWRSKISSQ